MKKRSSDLLSLFVAPLLGALFCVGKVFVVPNCLAFDFVDDANHTFVNMFSVIDHLRQGQLPLMNLYNNFGTPLIGDALTYPFALQSVTYGFLPFGIAMTVNRFSLAFLTIVFLTLYFRKYMSKFVSSICAFMVVLTPGFIWHFAHHHYQATLLCFTAILVFQENLLNKTRTRDYVLLCLLFALTMLSVSINIVFLIIPFVVMNHLILSRFKIDIRFFLLILAIAAGFLAVFPDVVYLFKLIPLSMRAVEGYRGLHLGTTFSFSLTALGLAIMAIGYSFYSRLERVQAARIFALGVVPVFICAYLVFDRSLWKEIYLLRSVDISRVLWLSNVFLMIGFGKMLDAIRQKPMKLKGFTVVAYILCVLDLYFLTMKIAGNSVTIKSYELFFIPPALLFLFFLPSLILRSRGPYKKDTVPQPATVHFVLIGSLLVFCQLYYCAHKILGYNDMSKCRTGHHFSQRGTDEFPSPTFLNHIEPHSRLAVEAPSYLGFDLKLTRNDLFGSGGRSVFLNRNFAEYLLAEDLIVQDQVPFAYHFKLSGNHQKLSDLGMRYFMRPRASGEGKEQGWEFLMANEKWVLYENVQKPTLLYLIFPNHKRVFLEKTAYQLMGNKIGVALPGILTRQVLVATFLNIPGWKAYVNGKRRDILHSNDCLLKIQLKPGDRLVSFEFEPFHFYHYLIGFLSAVFISFAGCKIIKRNSRSHKDTL